jgi:transposase
MVVMVGIDVHKDTHCAVLVDELGKPIGTSLTVRATDAGHRQLLRWAASRGGQDVQFAVEDCRHVSKRLEQALLVAGQTVWRVPPKLMSKARDAARTRGKSDPIDALAIARAALREPNLPRAEHTHSSRQIKLLVDHREDLVATRTQAQNRLRWHLHELDPELPLPAGALNRVSVLDRLADWLGEQPATVVSRIAGELVADIRALTVRVTALQKELAERVEQAAPQLLTLPGCGVLTAAKLLAETANPSRFRSEACFAMHAGVAPIPASSGKTDRYRLARGGNRQLNAALYRIAITQIRIAGDGQDYYQRRRAAGNTGPEAIRALKRRLARVVFNLLTSPSATAHNALGAAA